MSVPFKLLWVLFIAILLAVAAENFMNTPEEERFPTIKQYYKTMEGHNDND